ncbi:acyloxyacyl hydrolase [Flagellimonas sp.]|uniref:acyloxyacyl hydrolase n=1 Tax=Flagellimonas sp. TaxID=2058762 RepID=UPI003F49E681
MMRIKWCIIFFFFSIFGLSSFAQEIKTSDKKIWLGLNYGLASRNSFIYKSPDYLYRNRFLKVQANYLLLTKNRFNYELHIEPSIYFCEHQLLNKWFIQPKAGDDYLEQRDRFTQRREFNEYALNLGIILRYTIYKDFSAYLLGSIGPMFSEDDTERLTKGLAFSDILGLGFSHTQKSIRFDLRTTLRHNSNANFSKPNNGHDSIGLEMGVSFQLK